MKKITAALVLLALGAGTAAAAGLDVALSGPSAKNDVGSGKIAYTLTNNSAATLHVLRRQTPLGGLSNPLFEVTRNGETIAYVGPTTLHLPPTTADYVELKPGETLSTQIDLTAYYDMKAGGRFEVRYLQDARDVVKEAGDVAKAGVSAGYLGFDREGAASIWVDAAVDAFDASESPDHLDGGRFKAGAAVLAASNTFKQCTATRKAQIKEARAAATRYAKDAKDYLNAGRQGARFTAWFGGYDSAKYTKVNGRFDKIYTKLSSRPMAFDCGCRDADAIAYVTGASQDIYLCPPFWELALAGVYSKADTLVHEVSHLFGTANEGPPESNAYAYEGFAVNDARLD
ncbi:M35 family metallo-endopeptidase [Tahibacter soli]|uniref:M35 family metallo-endopeptidase n=1 Tax=Tahibacter soli TaxID=2983605 RepID=A0A9X3YNQ8_9GAMM|nr:M35 family metallo-endopeptidase [Tahibacter soli]MDC8015696.1 M35 family metallo-endopeptidase [Tahibacter soli]